MLRRAQIVVRGLVQGVGFRLAAHWEAKRLGLHGYVRNLPSGEVEIMAEGKGEVIDLLLDWARQGPPMANVENVVVDYFEPTGEFHDFSIR